MEPHDTLETVESIGSRPRRQGRGLAVSFVLHTLAGTAVVLLPILVSSPLPDTPTGAFHAFRYDPPPPPPVPPPQGSGLLVRARRTQARPPEPPPATEETTLTVDVPAAEVPAPAEEMDPEGGSPTGSPNGAPEGIEGGLRDGMVGGVPGGEIGGTIGASGRGEPVPVRDFDQPPRVLRQPPPEYPSDAFVKKVEGVVVLEILIDDSGHVVHARVVRSVPLLDRAAVNAVLKWLFAPAIRHGRPVPTLATAPVSFRIY